MKRLYLFSPVNFIGISFSIFLLLFSAGLAAQSLAVNNSGATANASSILDVSSSTKGMLIPRVALTGTADVTTIASPANSLLVYNTATVSNVTPGYYYWNGSAWLKFVTGTAWALRGNSGTIADTNFLGTTDNVSLSFRVNNQRAGVIDPAGPVFFGYQAGFTNYGLQNTGIGTQVLYSNVSGDNNTAIGSTAMSANISGSNNTATGFWAMAYNLIGSANTANGYNALSHNTTGNGNTAMGYEVMNNSFNLGDYNSAIGSYSLNKNNSGNFNAALGAYALYFNSTGSENTATGYQSLFNNSSGINNTANGSQSMYYNTLGSYNTANGYQALYNNRQGSYNTASGYTALSNNFNGSENTAIGYEAMAVNSGGLGNTATGVRALRENTAGVYNTALGYEALKTTHGNYNTSVGYNSLNAAFGNDGNTAVGSLAGNTSTGMTNCTYLGYQAFSANNLTNATAIGYNAFVATSNSLVLGDNNISVGIGISNPGNVLHVKGIGEAQVTIEAVAQPVGLLFKEGSFAEVARIQHNGTSGLEIEDGSPNFGSVGLVIRNHDVGIGTTGPTAKLSVNGDANNATGVWGVFSDERVKTITGEFTDGLNVIKQMRPITFNYNEKAPYKTSNQQVGIVAQELEKIAPYMVSKKTFDNFNDLREVNSQAYVFLLINAVKEQQHKIEELEKMVKDLSLKIK